MRRQDNNGLAGVVRAALARQKVLVAALAAVVLCAVGLSLVPPLVLERIVNRMAQRQEIPLKMALLYFGFLVLSGLCDAGKEILITVFGQRITHALRSAACHKLTVLPASYYTGHEAGKTTSLIVNDVDTLELLFASGIISMVADVCKVTGIVAVVFTRSVGLGIIILCMAPALFFLTRQFQRRMLAAQLANRVAIGKVNNFIPETLRNIRMIHSLYKESYMECRYDKAIEESYRSMEKSNLYDSVYSPVIVMMSCGVIALMMVLSATGGAMQTLFGMSVGTAVAVIAYVGQVFGPLESIGMEIQNIQSAVAGVQRIDAFLRQEERPMPGEGTENMPAQAANRDAANTENRVGDGGQEASPAANGAALRERNAGQTSRGEAAASAEFRQPSASPIAGAASARSQGEQEAEMPRRLCVQLQEVSFGYTPQRPVLQGLSLEVREGENVTLAGRTGVGKSTVFRLLLGLYSPQHGSVRVFGREAGEIPDAEKRRLFGYVEQTFYRVPGTVANQIALFDPAIRREDVERAAQLVGMHDSIMALPQGYDTPCDKAAFSQGQLQLLSIARAVVANPSVLLLDEITANLDSLTEQAVLEALQRACDGRTVLSISHRLYETMRGRLVLLDARE